MNVFTEAADLSSALAGVADRGVVFASNALAEPFRQQLGARGITLHLDQKRHRYLVAVSPRKAAPRSRGRKDWPCRDAETVWRAGPGSLVLLRGPGLGGVEAGRPLYMVTRPRLNGGCR
jgi:hypothetical protein